MTLETSLYLILLVLMIFIFYGLFVYQKKYEKEYENKLKNSLKEDYIIDPDTGAKLTLEQAESGKWNENQVEYFSENDYEKTLVDEEKNAELTIDFYRKNKKYKKTKFDNSEIEILESTLTLSKYDEWNYSNCFANESRNKIFFVPTVSIDKLNYQESQIMYWIKIQNISGHYHLYEVSKSEKILLNLTKKENTYYNGYYCETLIKSYNVSNLKFLLNRISEVKGFEFEIINDNLFIKSKRLVCKNDVENVEKIINNIC